MKKLVVYKSKFGSTKQYAEWIAEAADADLVAEEDLKPAQLAAYDVLVFGGYIRAGKIAGLAKLKVALSRLKEKKIFVFAVGAVQVEVNEKENLAGRNFKKTDFLAAPLFILPGKLLNSQFKGAIKLMMKMIYKTLGRKAEKGLTDYEMSILNLKDKDADMTDKNAIQPIVAAMNG